jgi:Polyketide cyclase / dehydrase and lipid transport
MLGRELTTTLEVSEYEPGRRFSLRALSGPIPSEVQHSFEPTGRGTRLVFRGQATAPGLPRLAQRMLKPMAEREFRGYFRELRRVLEDGA